MNIFKIILNGEYVHIFSNIKYLDLCEILKNVTYRKKQRFSSISHETTISLSNKLIQEIQKAGYEGEMVQILNVDPDDYKREDPK